MLWRCEWWRTTYVLCLVCNIIEMFPRDIPTSHVTNDRSGIYNIYAYSIDRHASKNINIIIIHDFFKSIWAASVFNLLFTTIEYLRNSTAYSYVLTICMWHSQSPYTSTHSCVYFHRRLKLHKTQTRTHRVLKGSWSCFFFILFCCCSYVRTFFFSFSKIIIFQLSAERLRV